VPPDARQVFTRLPSLETERLLLRRMRLADAADMFAYASRPEVTRFLPWATHRSLDDTHHFLRFATSCYRRGKPVNWGMELKENGRFIGTAGFNTWDADQAQGELGYVILPDYWNRGLMTEAVRAICTWGFEMGLHRISARCEVENFASARVMEKAGMRFEGVLRGQAWARGAFRDMKLYAVLRGEAQP